MVPEFFIQQGEIIITTYLIKGKFTPGIID